MNLFSVLNANNYVVFNRELAHAIGLNAALVLSEVLDKWEFFKKNSQLISLPGNPGEWFYLTIEEMHLRTTLGEKEQRNAIEQLMELGFIEVIRKGIPPRRHFRVIEENILEFFQIQNNFYKSSQKPNSTLLSGGIESSQRPNPIYKNPKEETKEEPSSSSSLSPSPKEEMRRMIFSCSDEEFEEAWEKLKKEDPKTIKAPIAWIEKVISNGRITKVAEDEIAQDKEKCVIEEKAREEKNRLVHIALIQKHKSQAQEKMLKYPKSINNECYVEALEDKVVLFAAGTNKECNYDSNMFEWNMKTGWW